MRLTAGPELTGGDVEIALILLVLMGGLFVAVYRVTHARSKRRHSQ